MHNYSSSFGTATVGIFGKKKTLLLRIFKPVEFLDPLFCVNVNNFKLVA